MWYTATASLLHQIDLLTSPRKILPLMLDDHQQGGHRVRLLYNIEIFRGNPTVDTAEFILPSLRKLLRQHLDAYQANKEEWIQEFLNPFLDKAVAQMMAQDGRI
jgi:hypothetical protein